MVRRVLISLFLAVVFILGGLAVMQGLAAMRTQPSRTEHTLALVGVKVRSLVAQDYTEQFYGYGFARAMRATKVAAEVAGLVQWISPQLETGRNVAAGEVLVKLDTTDLEQAVKGAAAAVAQARAAVHLIDVQIKGLSAKIALAQRELATARRELARRQALAQQQRVSASSVDQQLLQTMLAEKALLALQLQQQEQQAARQQSQARVKVQLAQLARARHDLARSCIKAPYAGRIQTRYVQLGSHVGPGTVLFSLFDPEQIEIPIALPASCYHRLPAAASVCLRVQPHGPILWQGQVARIAPLIDVQARTFMVFLEIKQAAGRIVPGQFVHAQVQGPTYHDVMVIPRTAFLQGHIFLARPLPGQPHIAQVQSLQPQVVRFLPEVALIKPPLKRASLIVLNNIELIASGSRVKIQTQTTKQDCGVGSRHSPGAMNH